MPCYQLIELPDGTVLDRYDGTSSAQAFARLSADSDTTLRDRRALRITADAGWTLAELRGELLVEAVRGAGR